MFFASSTICDKYRKYLNHRSLHWIGNVAYDTKIIKETDDPSNVQNEKILKALFNLFLDNDSTPSNWTMQDSNLFDTKLNVTTTTTTIIIFKYNLN